MMTRILLILALWLPLTATAETLKVSTVERPPFVMVTNGAYSGLSIDLWNALAAR